MRLWSVRDAITELRRGWRLLTWRHRTALVAPLLPRRLLLLRRQDQAWRRSEELVSYCMNMEDVVKTYLLVVDLTREGDPNRWCDHLLQQTRNLALVVDLRPER
jgi:hypothetical protein